MSVVSHPAAIDLSCPAEPDVPDGEMTRALADEFNNASLIAGRACRDALRRVCEWHQARGQKDARCDP